MSNSNVPNKLPLPEKLEGIAQRLINSKVNNFDNVNIIDDFNALDDDEKQKIIDALNDDDKTSKQGVVKAMELYQGQPKFNMPGVGIGAARRNRRKSRKTKKVRKSKKRAYSRRR